MGACRVWSGAEPVDPELPRGPAAGGAQAPCADSAGSGPPQVPRATEDASNDGETGSQ